MIQSPLNYTGGKYKLLPQILPLFPRDINVFVDLFCGGCNVGINVDCNRVIYNDLNENLLYLYNTFKNLDKESVLEWIYEIIEKYNLSLVSEHGYDYYGCESSKGLGNYNREGYLKLRADFNQKHANENFDYYYYVMLYVIIVYAFNNQIRFNSNGGCLIYQLEKEILTGICRRNYLLLLIEYNRKIANLLVKILEILMYRN